jgi:hexosaminidase
MQGRYARIGLLLVATAMLPSRSPAIEGSGPALIPAPVRLKVGSGSFELRNDTVLLADAAGLFEAGKLAAGLAPATGFSLEVVEGSPGRLRRALGLCGFGARETSACRTWVHLRSRASRSVGDEGYQLTVRSGGVKLRARSAAGLFYGAQTLRQLLPPSVFSSSLVAGPAWAAPAVRIKDYPRFSWRGAHLDVARHFIPKQDVLRLLDAMALHKLNRFHWHLTDDQGWRVEILQYPALTQVGAVRAESPSRPLSEAGFINFFLASTPDATPQGGFYTQDDVREVVAYAAERHIVVVPEIDLPGHSQAMIAAHPELGNTGAAVPVATTYGPQAHILNVEDGTFDFLEDVLVELLALFPGEFFHVGGDEVVFTEWVSSAAAQARMTALGFTEESELLAWFLERVADVVRSAGRRPIGWQNGLYDGGMLPDDVVLMEWLAQADGLAAAQQGRDVIMAVIGETYFDHPWLPLAAAEQAQLEAAFGAGHPLLAALSTDLQQAYGFDPLGNGLAPADAAHILGAQGQVWTEFIFDAAEVERFAFPRLTALAEAVWTPAARKDFADFDARLDAHLMRLDALGVQWLRR